MAAAAVLSPSVLASTASAAVDSERLSVAQEVNQPILTTASELLVVRISSVLQSLGYNDDLVEKVASRVSANIVESKIDLEDPLIGTSEQIGQLLDTDLLNREKLRSRNVYLNSNEPVLLLEIPKQSDKSIVELTQVKHDFIGLLQARSIVPVRVYVRKTDDLKASQFGFCLLNVVNTDIGGPNMVQLLDAAFHGEHWKNDLIIKEAFNGRDLLWRDEVVVGSPTQQEQQPARIDKADVAESAEGDANWVDETAIDSLHGGAVPETKPLAAYRDINETLEEHEEDKDEPTEHPAMAELRQWESSRQIVEHPSWNREHGGDLLDIITTQSASIKDEDAALTTKSASDDFELVEKV